MKRLLLGLVLGAAIALAGALAYRLLFDRGERPLEWVLASYSGTVEVSARGADWRPAEIKMRLTDSDRLRTGEDGEALLLREESHVTVRALTELEVASLTEEASSFDMVEGNVYVEARGDRIHVETLTEAEVDAHEAGFGMTVRDDGFVEVAVRRGLAEFTAMGVTQSVSEGNLSHATTGRPPTQPTPIPETILLNVSFPDADTFNARLARVQGQVDAGSRVRVGESLVETDADGRFAIDVALEEGANQIEVKAVDVLGRSRVERSRPILVDVTPPGLEGATIGSRRTSR
jgi:hypothetical protein